MTHPPLIVTLKINEAAEQQFSALRDQYFPAHINYLRAHLTLFHLLPDQQLILDALSNFANRETFPLQVSALHHMGNGVAYKISSGELQAYHAGMQQTFEPYLVSQDRKKLWPHITIQNKVTAYKSKLLYEALAEKFEPFQIVAEGLTVWRYLKGPWEFVGDLIFEKK